MAHIIACLYNIEEKTLNIKIKCGGEMVSETILSEDTPAEEMQVWIDASLNKHKEMCVKERTQR